MSGRVKNRAATKPNTSHLEKDIEKMATLGDKKMEHTVVLSEGIICVDFYNEDSQIFKTMYIDTVDIDEEEVEELIEGINEMDTKEILWQIDEFPSTHLH
jgi:hypothetical protein